MHFNRSVDDAVGDGMVVIHPGNTAFQCHPICAEKPDPEGHGDQLPRSFQNTEY